MTTCPLPPDLAARFVGDPIDAVTGAFFDDVQDFIVASDELPIAWRRTYSTERIAEDRGLGRGHSHAFDHRLKLDLDGIRYTSPLGEAVHFPSFHAGEARVARCGYVLTRDGTQLSLERPSGPELVFDLLPSAHARLTEVRSVGRSIFVGYDFTGRLASLGDTNGNVVSFTWDEEHILSARVLARGATAHVELVRYRYEGALLVEVQDAYKHSLLYAYDDAGRLVRRTDRRGYSFSFEYDADGRCIHSAGDDGMLEVRLEHFPFELRTCVTKSDGGVWEYFYDSAKTLTKIVDPEGIERSFVPRPEDGQIALEIDGAGNEIVSLYDDDGRRIGRRDALGRPIAPRRGHPVPSTPAQYELGRLANLPEELPTRELLQYSLPPVIAGSLVLGSGAGEGRVREVRDVQGLLIREERDGLARRYAYDENGNLRWDIDFDGANTKYAYASYNHRVEETDPNGFVTSFEYTKEDVLGGVVDAQHTRTVFPRDSRNNVMGVSRANVWKEGYRRDGAGRLVEKTSANGTSLYQITRGPQGEVLERAFGSGGFERFEYDRALRVVAAETPAGKQTFAYDYDGNRIADLRDGKGVRRRFIEGALSEYKVLDRFVTRYRHLETPHAREVVITDPTGREHRVRDHKCGVFTREFASGSRETVQYHPDGHCLARLVQGASDKASVWSRRYDYSAEGYLVARHDSARGTTRFEHDAAHRLVAEHPPAAPSRVFEHDAAGNLLANGGGYALYHPGNVLAEANGRRFEHDLRQAVCSEAWQGGFRRFHRDERDQLVRVESYRAAPADSAGAAPRWEPLPDWTARYDALNRRVDKTVAGQTTVFYWDTDRLAAEVQPSGSLRVYVYADALAMTPLLFVDYASVDAAPESGVVYAVLADHLGCPERVEDMAGQTVWSAVVAPYGALQVTAGAGFHQPLRWPGHYYDAELGLQYNRFRTYSPALGRYLEPDPLGRAGGLENAYGYTHNPLFRVDTHGLNECPEAEAARKKAAAENEEEGKPDEEATAKAQADRDEAQERLNALKGAGLGDTAAAEDARYARNAAERDLKGLPPLSRDDWNASAQQLRDNTGRGADAEDAAFASTGIKNNNAPGEGETLTVTNPDGTTTTTRPDAITDKSVVDVKSAPNSADPDGGPRVVYNTEQLNAQQAAAQNAGKQPVTVISNDNPDGVRPSQPLADNSTVYHHNPSTDTWSEWNATTGRWDTLPAAPKL